MGLSWAAMTADHRGNSLNRYKIYISRDHTRHYVMLDGCDSVCDQVDLFLDRFGGSEVDPNRIDSKGNWDYAFEWPGDVPDALVDMLDLISDVLTLTPVPGVDVALALDFYKQPDEDGELQNTRAGRLVHVLKYYVSSPNKRVAAGNELAGWMAEVISRHPLFDEADRIVVVPSTKSGISEMLGRAVAGEVGKPTVVAVETTGSQVQDKSGEAQPKRYEIHEDLSGEAVIILDDVYWRGNALRGVAAACIAAGASRVLGLVGARNLRS